MAHVRQSRPGSRPVFEVQVVTTFEFVPFSLGGNYLEGLGEVSDQDRERAPLEVWLPSSNRLCASNIHMHIYIHTYMYIYIHRYIHVYLHISINIYIHIYTYVYVYVYMYTCIHAYIYAYIVGEVSDQDRERAPLELWLPASNRLAPRI